MLIQSPWKATLHGIILLDFTDLMQTEPSIVPAGKEQTVQPLRAQFASHFGRGGITHTIQFSRVVIFDTWAQAMGFLGQHLAALPICQAAVTMEIALQGGGNLMLENAVLTSAGRPTVAEGNRFSAHYTVAGGRLAYSATPGIENTDGSSLTNTDRSTVENTQT